MADSMFPFDFWPEHPDADDNDTPAQGFYYDADNIDFDLPDADSVTQWLAATIERQSKKLGAIQYVFCNDEQLLDINVQFLQHDTLTDIITFDYSEADTISGDIYISIDRVTENAQTHQVSFTDELHRVMVHGVLHLCGHKDKSPEDEAKMRLLENEALAHRA